MGTDKDLISDYRTGLRQRDDEVAALRTRVAALEEVLTKMAEGKYLVRVLMWVEDQLHQRIKIMAKAALQGKEKESSIEISAEEKILSESAGQFFRALSNIIDCEKSKLCTECHRLAANALHDYWNKIEAPKAEAALAAKGGE